MANKTIGLTIQLNGVTGTVKDIQTLENEIKKARQDLKQLEIGSDLFNQLSKEIGLAETQLLSLIQSTKRLTREREIEGIGKLGQGIASSFAAAQSAVALFGTESEEVTRAATAAQNLLTLALSARGIAEVKLGAELVARTIAQRALTAAELTEIKVLQRLFAVIAANPYTALLVVLGSLVAAYAAFGDSEEEVTEKTKTLNEVMAENNVEAQTTIKKLQILQKLYDSETTTLEAKAAALNEINKLLPGINKLQGDDTKIQQIRNTAIEIKIELIKERAALKALESVYTSQLEQALKEENKKREKRIELLSEETLLEKTKAILAKLYYGYELKNQAVIRNQKEINDLKQETVVTDEQITEQTAKVLELQGQLDALLKPYTTKKGKALKEEKANYSALREELEKLIELENERLLIQFKLGGFEAFIINELEQRTKKTEDLVESTNKLKTAQELLKEINDKIVGQKDDIGKYYNDILTGVKNTTDAINKLTTTGDVRNAQIFAFLNAFKQQVLGISTIEGLADEYKNEFRQIAFLVENNVKILEKVFKISPEFPVEEWEKAVINFALKTGDLLSDPLQRTSDELISILINSETEYNNIKDKFLTTFLEKEKAAKAATFQTLEDEKNKYKEGTKERLKAQEEIDKAEESIRKTGEKLFETLYKNTVEFQKMKAAVADVSKEVTDLNEKLKEQQPEALLGYIVDNAAEFAKQYRGFFKDVTIDRELLSDLNEKLARKDFSTDKKYAKLLSQLQSKLDAELTFIDSEGNVKRIDITRLSYEERLALLAKFLEAEVDLIEDAEAKKQKKRKKTQDAWVDGLKVFADAIAQIASLEAQYTQLRLDKLEQEYNKTLNNIIGDSEEASKKRLDLEKEYQAEKAAIEKAALIKSLKLQLLQTTADVAQAIASNLENPVVAAIAGIAGAFQLDIIRRQLQLAQAAAGGMLVKGRRHEYGGVRASGGLELEGGEAIINRVATINYQGLLSSINQSGGGQALVANASNSLMEERLMQAIAKQRQEPIRAYVLSSEIQNAQAINKRLSELSTL